jgi:Domain of unknown function (DUF4331)
MSSHREAPEISKDPVADSTDLYAFVSPDRPDSVTILANYIPLEAPAGGPNFYEFGNDVIYQIKIDNDGDGHVDILYEFIFTTKVANPNTFLYNVGPIQSIDDANWNRRQFYKVVRTDVRKNKAQVLANGLACPPCNIGPLSTPDYASLSAAAIHDLPGNRKVFAGQRAEGFYVDLGAIFDLGILRPVQQLHNLFGLANVPELAASAPGVNTISRVNVHTIALQVPMTDLTRDGKAPTDPASAKSVIGVWTAAKRRKVSVRPDDRTDEDKAFPVESGPFVQVSRLGNPLVNEVLIPMVRKDYWNLQPPFGDSEFADGVAHPELATLLPVLYPGVFPNLQALNDSGKPRADLLAILMTGIPAGIVPGFQNFSSTTVADMLRLNMAIPPATTPSNLGLIGGDPAGFPNGRRVFDDVVTIELRAIAGATYPLVDPTFTPDAAVPAVDQGLTTNASDLTAKGSEVYIDTFPYLGEPFSGYSTPAATPA